MQALQVKDVMTHNVHMARSNEIVRNAAKMMKYLDCGVIPVGDDKKAVGMLTDRDIAIRVVADAKGDDTLVSEVMSTPVYTCDEEATLDEAAEIMRGHNVSRLIVTKKGKLSGIVTLGCLFRNHGIKKESEKVLNELLYSSKTCDCGSDCGCKKKKKKAC